MNVIQFRNSFDSQGPGVPGVRPAEAVARLQDFQQRYTQFEAKRKTLDSVQLLFGIVPTPFPELDKTGEVSFIYFFPSLVQSKLPCWYVLLQVQDLFQTKHGAYCIVMSL